MPDPELCTPGNRRQLMEREDYIKFDAAHFVADYFDDGAIQDAMQWRAWWEELPSDGDSDVSVCSKKKHGAKLDSGGALT